MRCNVSAALALILWGAGVTTAAVAQQPVKVGVLNDQTGLYADLSGMGSVYAARMAVEDYRGKVLGRPSGPKAQIVFQSRSTLSGSRRAGAVRRSD